METMIFFDINGTLIARDERTDIPYSLAVDELLGRENSMKGVDTSARSDQDVFMEILRRFGIPYRDSLWSNFLHLYEGKLEEYKATDVWRPNADALDYLNYLLHKPVSLGLISGELRIGARYKLEKIGIWHHFPIGGFGEDGLRRFDIAEAALKKAEIHYAKRFQRVFIIGDTLQDIRTARHLGAKVISISTGSDSQEDLQQLRPDYLISSFGEMMTEACPFTVSAD